MSDGNMRAVMLRYYDEIELQIEHLRDGQIVAHWHQIDELGLRRQLGLPAH